MLGNIVLSLIHWFKCIDMIFEGVGFTSSTNAQNWIFNDKVS
jgi:hypothetical protein